MVEESLRMSGKRNQKKQRISNGKVTITPSRNKDTNGSQESLSQPQKTPTSSNLSQPQKTPASSCVFEFPGNNVGPKVQQLEKEFIAKEDQTKSNLVNLDVEKDKDKTTEGRPEEDTNLENKKDDYMMSILENVLKDNKIKPKRIKKRVKK